jgi:hypothetical protein
MIEAMAVEGTLDILWMNTADKTATPRYDLIFARYAGFKNGAQQSNKIIGTYALKAYLIDLGFAVENAEFWAKQASQKFAVSIPNVMMPGDRLTDFGL